MSLRTIIDEIGNLSLRRFGSVSRTHQTPTDHHKDGMQQSYWANMPPELIRDVLVRVEVGECEWPGRKDVVACAGVCKSWREVVKDIVMTPELGGRITFPISVKQPGAKDLPLRCFIKRNRSNQTYRLYLGLTEALTDNGKFLLAARRHRRPTCTDYLISLDPVDISKASKSYVGKLRSNFLGTKFAIYDAQPPHTGAMVTKSHSTRLLGSKQVSPTLPAGNYPVAHIAYALNVLGSRGPRKMQCIMDSIPSSAAKPGGVAPTPTALLSTSDSFSSTPSFRSKSSTAENMSGPSSAPNNKLILKNKDPRWHEQLQCWCLNFRGRVTVASVKNFQLVASEENLPVGHEHDNVLLQFGKVGKDLFTMDYRCPLSAFQAFAICLSSFDTKIACE